MYGCIYVSTHLRIITYLCIYDDLWWSMMIYGSMRLSSSIHVSMYEPVCAANSLYLLLSAWAGESSNASRVTDWHRDANRMLSSTAVKNVPATPGQFCTAWIKICQNKSHVPPWSLIHLHHPAPLCLYIMYTYCVQGARLGTLPKQEKETRWPSLTFLGLIHFEEQISDRSDRWNSLPNWFKFPSSTLAEVTTLNHLPFRKWS